MDILVYYDYDGVFGDTMNPAKKEMKELGLYETEEGRTKYFQELNWSEFLIKTPFIKNSPETVNTLIEKGYKTAFLTHVNSLNEYIAKIDFIKNIKELNNKEKIDIIAVPRVIDKSVTINPNGNILIDDRLENIIAWEAMGGIGVYFSTCQHDSYITIENPLELINIVLSMDKREDKIYLSGNPAKDKVLLEKVKEKSGKVPANNDVELEYMSRKIHKYQCVINSAHKYHTSILNHHLVERNYDIKQMENYFKTIDFYKNLIDKKIVYIYKFSYSIYHDLLVALLKIDIQFGEKPKKLALNNKRKYI